MSYHKLGAEEKGEKDLNGEKDLGHLSDMLMLFNHSLRGILMFLSRY